MELVYLAVGSDKNPWDAIRFSFGLPYCCDLPLLKYLETDLGRKIPFSVKKSVHK